MTNPYAPDETSAQIFDEETWLQGSLLGNIAYGVELTLFVMCFAILIRQTNRFNYKKNVFLLTFISVIFSLGSIFMGSQAKFMQLAFIENRNYPGGPSAYVNNMFSIPVDEGTNISFIVGNWIMDAFLLYRLIVIYKTCGTARLVALVLLPCLMLITSVGLGLTYLVQTSNPNSSPFNAVDITLSYYVMSLALNVIVTFLIVGRLLLYRWRLRRVLGPNHDTCYANVAAMLIESASLYSVFAILFLVPFGLKYDLGNVFLQSVSQVQTVSSLLIIFRVATGRAWTEDTSAQIMTDLGSNTIQPGKLTNIHFATASESASSAVIKNVDGVPVMEEIQHDLGGEIV